MIEASPKILSKKVLMTQECEEAFLHSFSTQGRKIFAFFRCILRPTSDSRVPFTASLGNNNRRSSIRLFVHSAQTAKRRPPRIYPAIKNRLYAVCPLFIPSSLAGNSFVWALARVRLAWGSSCPRGQQSGQLGRGGEDSP